jgi:hypothetical protein
MHHGGVLVLAGVAFALGLLVAPLAVIQDAANRRRRMRVYFDKIEACVLGGTKSVFNRQNAQVFVFRSYYPDFASPDVIVKTECPVYNA